MLICKLMKRRSTTPVSAKGLVTKSVIIAAAVTMAIVPPFGLQKTARADQYDDQIAAYQAEIDQYSAQAKALGEQVKTLQGELAALNIQTDTIKAQIAVSQTQLAQLKQQIADLQVKIDQNKAALGDTLADMYASDNVTPLEMLAGSSNIADYMDQQEVRTSMTDQLSQYLTTINKQKAEVEQKKADQERVLVDLQKSQDALASKEAEKQDLISKTQGDQNTYNSLVSDRQAKQLATMQAQQAAIEAAIKAASGGRGNVTVVGGSSGGYPWDSSNCYVDAYAYSWYGSDGNGGDGYGYGCRQCVSYVAWRVGKERGYVPTNWGNAYDWVANGRAAGYTVSREPRAGSAGVITAGGSPGHIVWVESVNGDGTLTIAQYNYFNAGGPGWGNFSRMIVPAGTYQWFVYF